MKKPIKRNVVKMRTERNESQTVFWGRLGVTQSAGSRYENDDVGALRIPEPVSKLLDLAYGKKPLEALAQLRGCTVADLIESHQPKA